MTGCFFWGASPRRNSADSVQTARLNQASLDRQYVRLAIAQCARRGVDRVVAKDEIMRMWSGRAEDELGIGQRFELHRFARRLECHELPASQFVRGRKRA